MAGEQTNLILSLSEYQDTMLFRDSNIEHNEQMEAV